MDQIKEQTMTLLHYEDGCRIPRLAEEWMDLPEQLNWCVDVVSELASRHGAGPFQIVKERIARLAEQEWDETIPDFNDRVVRCIRWVQKLEIGIRIHGTVPVWLQYSTSIFDWRKTAN